jgi:hypothetical protein
MPLLDIGMEAGVESIVDNLSVHLKYWVMHSVARVSINIVYRNLRTQQMSVLVLPCTFYTTCFGPYWWPSRWFVMQKIRRQLCLHLVTEYRTKENMKTDFFTLFQSANI